MFSPQEQAYLQTQMLARLGTVAPDGQPDVDVVGFQFDGTHFYKHSSRKSSPCLRSLVCLTKFITSGTA